MAVTGIIHHFGTFLLFTSVVLLVITNITAPVVHNISLLRIDINNNAPGQDTSAVTLGTFGYCMVERQGEDDCSRSMVGYDPAQVVADTTGREYYSTAAGTARALTRVMILHPIAAGIAFIAFALSLGAGTFGSLLASLTALLAFFVTLVPLVTDFVMFSIIRSGINDSSDIDASASFGAGLWTLLAAAVLLLVATVVVFFTCCSARMHRRRDARATKAVDGYAPPEAPRRRRWF